MSGFAHRAGRAGRVASIEIVSPEAMRTSESFAELPKRIVAGQSLGVDVVSGVSYSSVAYLKAVEMRYRTKLSCVAAPAPRPIDGGLAMRDIKRSSIMGDGPRLAIYLLPALAAALAAGILWPGRFAFAGKFYGVAFALGILLAVFGLAFQASSAFELIRAYRAGKLATRGSFGLCRNPIFSWWIFSILPALALMLNSWLLLAVAVVFRVLSGGLAKTEEAELGELFGEEYWRYKARTRAFLPLPYFKPITFRRCLRAALILAGLGVAAIAVYSTIAVPAMRRLGATSAEARDDLPGDEYVGAAATGYTQAIDIEAPAGEAWKWLIQVGYKRAGWYNVDAINRLVGPEYFRDPRGSAVRIVPELQDLAVGDKIYLVPQLGMTVVRADPATALVLIGDPSKRGGDNVAWTFAITPRGDEACRLVVRFRSQAVSGFLLGLAGAVVNDLGGATIQQPAMLWGLKRRAERTFAGELL